MRKLLGLLLGCTLLAACYAQNKTASLPQQTLLAPRGAAPAQDVKTLASAVQNSLSADTTPPQAQTSDFTSRSAEQTPTAVPLEQPTSTAAQRAAQPAQTTAAQAEQTETQPAQTAAASSEPEPPQPPQPAPDQAVFENEDLIDFEGRILHPYAALPPDAQAPQHAPWAYEQLKYGVYYSFIKAGTAYIRNRGLVNINGRPAYLLQTTAFSAAVIDAFFKVRDVNQSWLDAENFYSLGYGQSVREDSYIRDEWLTFDYNNHTYSGKIKKKKDGWDIKGPLEIKVLDILTSLYYVRSQKLVPGQDIVFDIVNREKQYPLVVKVLKKEKVKTDAGTFNCIVVEPQLRGEGIFVSKGKSLKVWLTDDEYKMPVKMQVEVFIGSVSAKLLEYKRQEPTNIL